MAAHQEGRHLGAVAEGVAVHGRHRHREPVHIPDLPPPPGGFRAAAPHRVALPQPHGHQDASARPLSIPNKRNAALGGALACGEGGTVLSICIFSHTSVRQARSDHTAHQPPSPAPRPSSSPPSAGAGASAPSSGSGSGSSGRKNQLTAAAGAETSEAKQSEPKDVDSAYLSATSVRDDASVERLSSDRRRRICQRRRRRMC